MTVDQMREKIIHVYAGPTWRYRVQGMEDRQVIAIYRHMVEDGIFDKIEKISKQKKKANTLHEEQLTIFDLLKEDKSESEEKQV